MKIGIFAPLSNPFATPEYIETLGWAAEERGFHSIWAAEHVVLFDEYASRYPYAADGRIPAGGDNGVLDPFLALGFVAAATKKIRLGTGICLVPQKNPVYTAKEAATVDWLSNGRLDFGVGIGWLAEEFRALGVPFGNRGARCRAYLEVIRRLWMDPVSEYKGEFYELPPCRQYPKPIQQPHPPIHFGGESDPALRRVADVGQGWYGFNLLPEQAAERIKFLDSLLAERGRTRDEIEISICPYLQPLVPDDLGRYRDVGVDQIIVLLVALSREQLLSTLDTFARTLVEPASRL
jgi:probable F420-dependent oxidoreductase